MKTLKTIPLIGLLAFNLQVFSQDINSNTERLTVGLQGTYAHWSSDYFEQLDERDPSGIGGGIRVGYGLNQRFEPFVRYELQTFNLTKKWDTHRLSAFSLGLRANFGGTLQKIRPFVEIGYTIQSMKINPVELNGKLVTFKMSGPSTGIGGGVNYFLTPQIALNGNFNAVFGKFNSFLIDNVGSSERPDIQTFRFSVGINYYFDF